MTASHWLLLLVLHLLLTTAITLHWLLLETTIHWLLLETTIHWLLLKASLVHAWMSTISLSWREYSWWSLIVFYNIGRVVFLNDVNDMMRATGA